MTHAGAGHQSSVVSIRMRMVLSSFWMDRLMLLMMVPLLLLPSCLC